MSNKEKAVRKHRYIISAFGPDKAHEVIITTDNMFLSMGDLASAKQFIVTNYLPEGSVVESVSIAAVSYLGYASSEEFGENTDGE